jgi:hypothetical protein
MIWKYKSNSIFSQQQRSRLEHRSAPQWSPIHPAPGWQWHFPPCPFDTAFLKIPLLLSCNSLLNNFTFSQIILYTILKCYFVRNTFSTAESSTSSVCSVSLSPGAPVTLCFYTAFTDFVNMLCSQCFALDLLRLLYNILTSDNSGIWHIAGTSGLQVEHQLLKFLVIVTASKDLGFL